MNKPDAYEIEKIKHFLREDAVGLSESNISFLLGAIDLIQNLNKDKLTQQKAIETLRIHLGILPKSERGNSDKFDPKKTSEQTSGGDAARKSELERQIHALIRKYRRQFRQKLGRHRQGEKQRTNKTSPMNGGDDTIYHQTERDILEQGDKTTVTREDHFNDLSGLRSSTEQVTRHEFDVILKTTTYSVETVTDPRTGQSVRASMREIGPEGSQYTWKAMVNIVHLVVVFGMPAHRAAAFLGNKKKIFGESTILRLMQFVARACAPIYEVTCRQMAQSLRLQGDDSSTRVLEVERDVLEANGNFIAKSHDESSADKMPESLQHRRSRKKNNRFTHGIADSISQVAENFDNLLDFQFKTKTGTPKKKINISMVTGRIYPENQFSQISLVRTHLGSFGNLLDQLLDLRDETRQELSVQSDLSTSNNPSDNHCFRINIVGCSAHARRPFWRYRNVDPLNCYYLLRGFALLSSVEDIIDCQGRNEQTSNYWRGKYGQKIWDIIKRQCETMMTQHMPNSELHIAAKYVITHFAKLTLYLSNPWLHPTNNQIERTLRAERTMLNNSKFRQSRNGRVVYDILRTIQLCCAGANVQFLDYLMWFLPNHEEGARDPENWTPFAYRLKMNQSK